MDVSISVGVMFQNLPFPLCAHLTLRLKLAGARAAPRAAAAGGAGTQAGGGGEQAAVEGEHLAADEALDSGGLHRPKWDEDFFHYGSEASFLDDDDFGYMIAGAPCIG